MEGFLRGKCIPGDLKVNETNAEYLVRKFSEADDRCAALSAKLNMINDLMEAAEQANKLAQEATEKLVQERNALAAENETLNKFIAASCFVQAGEELAWYPAIDHAPETPATDAFLAEVRAQGVERYTAQLKSEAELANETGWDGAAKFLISESEKVLAFAAQLRQESAQ
ncbi:hypothetical protein EX404_07815 [Salmonella enterica]|nr:hypothetical protein [Salmonella enterica]ECI8163210.1 hypothetical protein [Salmonella enterica subsp. enterica serovar Richmond]ECJ5157381.1 hypothetical protein [Salmonella enterica subsp. enterica serovar Richmond]